MDSAPKGTLADYCGHGDSPSWVSNMLHEVRATQPSLQDLENIADFFQVSVNELFRPARAKDLSADEQRLLLAFRSIDGPIQAHVLAVVEATSLSGSESLTKRLRHIGKTLITSEVERASHGRSAAVPADYVAQLSQLALSYSDLSRILTDLTHRLAAAATANPDADRPAVGDRPHSPHKS